MSTAAEPVVIETLATELESLLRRLDEAYVELEQCLISHRDSLRKAEAKSLSSVLEREQSLLARLAGLEHERRALVARAMSEGRIKAAPDARLADLASSLLEPWRSRLFDMAGNVRERMSRVRREQGSLRAASASLLAHMEGLIRQVARRLSHSGTYSQRGVVETGLLATAVDVRL